MTDDFYVIVSNIVERIGSRACMQSADIDDLVSEVACAVMVSFNRSPDKYDTLNDAAIRLSRVIASRKIVDTVRIKMRDKIALEEIGAKRFADLPPRTTDELSNQEKLKLIDQMPAKLRYIVLLKKAGVNYKEIAELLGISKSTLYNRINDARKFVKSAKNDLEKS